MHASLPLACIPKSRANTVKAGLAARPDPVMTAVLGRLAALIHGWPRARLLVALSGGVDSLVLLHALVQLRRQLRPRGRLKLRAVHIDHHLQAASGEWRTHCERVARGWRVSLTVCDADIVLRRGDSLEAVARAARYAQLANTLRPGEVLLTAQHQDDQLETVLLQLLRGAGPAGLAAMPESAPFGAGHLLRPLLAVSRHDISHYAKANTLRWIEDPSNSDLRFDRNYLRARVLPALLERWPSAAVTVSRSARHLAEAQALVAELAAVDLAAVAESQTLSLGRLARLPPMRQRATLRLWLQQRGCSTPDTRHLARILNELPAARSDANPLVRWPGGEVRRYQGLLFCVKPSPPSIGGSWEWRRGRAFALGLGWGSLRVVADANGPWPRSALPERLIVAFRTGGERVAVGGQHRSLKELLRDAKVLPWMRQHIPIVSSAAELWCVPGLWSHAAPADARASRAGRIAIQWQDAPLWCCPRGPQAS